MEKKLVNNMYKSAYKFGLFVMASLIMLSTVVTALPMGNMNLFSDVMLASGKNHDEYDNHQEYESYYYFDNNDNDKYRPNYELC